MESLKHNVIQQNQGLKNTYFTKRHIYCVTTVEPVLTTEHRQLVYNDQLFYQIDST
jgi:hypothetical protein